MKTWIIEKCKWLKNQDNTTIDKFALTAMYYAINNELNTEDKARLAIAYTIAKCWTEYGLYEFDLIERWTIKMYENTCSM